MPSLGLILLVYKSAQILLNTSYESQVQVEMFETQQIEHQSQTGVDTDLSFPFFFILPSFHPFFFLPYHWFSFLFSFECTKRRFAKLQTIPYVIFRCGNSQEHFFCCCKLLQKEVENYNSYLYKRLSMMQTTKSHAENSFSILWHQLMNNHDLLPWLYDDVIL